MFNSQLICPVFYFRFMTKNLFIVVALASLWFTGCIFDGGKGADVKKRNTFTDFQHVGGYVNGHWTSDHNPIQVTGDPIILAGDTLVIDSGVIVEGGGIMVNGTLIVNGTASAPVVLNAVPAIPRTSYPGLGITGRAKMSHVIDQNGFLFTSFGFTTL